MFDCCEGHVTEIVIHVYATMDDNKYKMLGYIRPDGDYENLIGELESGCCPVCDGWPLVKKHEG